MSDTEAIQRLKAGDIGGLETLVTCYQWKAIKAAFLILHDEQLAEDVVQETFVRIYHQIRSFDALKPFEPYLMRSVVNAALNCAKQSSAWTQFGTGADFERVEGLISRAAAMRAEASLETEAETREQRQEILKAMALLPPRQRAVIVQRYYLEMSEKEMAHALDAPPGTIKWLLNEARRRLRAFLGASGAWKND
jgi:RNA polymerase sigma-70 factor (ECF subfamily)